MADYESYHEDSMHDEVLYEITFPYITEESEPDFQQLFQCQIPKNMSKQFFLETFQKYPFIQQDIFQRALPNTDFPPLPTVDLDEISDPENYQKYLPINQRQLTLDECEQLKKNKNSHPQLKQYLEDYWLMYEPYIPKWHIAQNNDEYNIPNDENLPPHASSFRSAFNASIIASASAKKYLITQKHSFTQGIDYQCFMCGALLLNQIVPIQFRHLIQIVSGELLLNGQEIQDQKTQVMIRIFQNTSIKISRYIKHKRTCNQYKQITYQMIDGYMKNIIMQYLLKEINKVTKCPELYFALLSEQRIESFNQIMLEADRLEQLLQNLVCEKLDLLEGEYLFNEENRQKLQSKQQIHGLTEEMRVRNTIYNYFCPATRVPKQRLDFTQMSDYEIRRYKAVNHCDEVQEPVLNTSKRFAPHSQSLPPNDSLEYFYNQSDYKIDQTQSRLFDDTEELTANSSNPQISQQIILNEPQRFIVSNRKTLPQYLIQLMQKHIMFNKRPSIQMPPVCFYKSGFHGHGLFCLANIQSMTILSEYAGEVIGQLLTELRDQEYQNNGFSSVYMFQLGTDRVVDATFCGNYGRFINHSCDPNSESALLFRDNNQLAMKFKEFSNGIGVVERTTKQMFVGQECTQNYNMTRVAFDQKIVCYCGARRCTGFMN